MRCPPPPPAHQTLSAKDMHEQPRQPARFHLDRRTHLAGGAVALAAVFLWPIMLRQGHWPALRQHWRPILFAGVINSAIPFALFSWAVLHIATGLTSILNATVPLFGALVAWVWLGDRINRLRWAGLALGFVGVA